jgi:hypothetical protein
MVAQNKRKNSQRKHKSMFTSKVQTNSPNRGAVKSTPAAAANIASTKSTRQQTTLPSDADIATKAYEIWLSRGQESGNDQQHWFEAKRQLQPV